MSKSKPTPAKKLPRSEWNETEQAELLQAWDEALRWRYGVDPAVGSYLKRLEDFAVHGKGGKIVQLAMELGLQVLLEALEHKTEFIDSLRTAIRRNESGLSTETRFQLAYNEALLVLKKDYLRRWENGEHHMERSDEVWPSVMDVVQAYLRRHPKANVESTKSQIKRWARLKGKKIIPKRLKP